MELPFTLDDICNAALELVRVNKLDSCYIRPIVLRGYGDAGVNPFNCPIEVYMACWDWGRVPRRRSGARRSGRGREFLAASGAEHFAADGQGRRQLYEFGVDSHGSHGQWLCRRHRAGCLRARQRRIRRKSLPGEGWHGDYAAAFHSGASGNHAKHDHDSVPRLEYSRSPSRWFRAKCCISPTSYFSAGTAVEITPIRTVDRIKIGTGTRGPITHRFRMNSLL